MSRKSLIVVVAIAGLIVGSFAALRFAPKHYFIGDRMSQTVVFWNAKEAFLLLDIASNGKTTNFFTDKLGATKYAYLSFYLGSMPRMLDQDVVAFHLIPDGRLDRMDLGHNSTTFGSWSLKNGSLQLTPLQLGIDEKKGFRWDGSKFIPVLPMLKPDGTAIRGSKLTPDDDDDNDSDSDGRFLNPTERKAFRDAGWHYKRLNGYDGTGMEATLPIALGKASFELIIDDFPRSENFAAGLDTMAMGTRSLTLSQQDHPETKQELWSAPGWRQVSKSEFQSRARFAGRTFETGAMIWVWLIFLVFAMLLKFGVWGNLFFNIFGTKRRVLKQMATSYSFPPATEAQFPALDKPALERYTQQLESMGFTRLLDFSLVGNTPNPIPSFCRLFASTRNQCFAEVAQLFPRTKAPMELKCAFQSCLTEDWSLTFTDRSPRATSSILRRKKALGINMPEATLTNLLQAFLQMRETVCQDLGISVVRDYTLEAYFARVQRTAGEMREAVKQRSFFAAIPQVYYRKFAFLKNKPEYTWLGDYPKEAQRRRAGFPLPNRAPLA